MNNNVKAEKRKFRSEIRKAYSELSPEYIAESDAGIFSNLSSLPEFIASKVIFSYYSIDNEPDTHKIIDLALKMGKMVALPVCYGEGKMYAVLIKSLADLRPGAYNIPAPSSDSEKISPELIDFAIIPALAYDKNGCRLGQGGGYYDRFLEKNNFFAAGIVRSRFLLESVPCESHDARLFCVITEKVIARL
jgi:5,10-methenyltetrahydrofolate synthetase